MLTHKVNTYRTNYMKLIDVKDNTYIDEISSW